MSDDPLSDQERRLLLEIARQAIEQIVTARPGQPRYPLDLPERLRQPGATFVTLTRQGRLRGCIGTLQAYQTLAEDVIEHAQAAAVRDYRFDPVRPEELAEIKIEISRLTDPQPLVYQAPAELPQRLRPGMDGVILRDGSRRATFLPQVWQQLPQPAEFLNQLCQKMGAPPDLWRRKVLEVSIYQVEEFHE